MNRQQPWWIALLLGTAVVAVYHHVVRFELLLWDDKVNILDNEWLQPVRAESFSAIWTQPYAQLYIPVSYTVFAVEAWLATEASGSTGAATLDSTVFHIGNLALHVGCVWLVFGILRSLTRHDAAAGFGAALFALHPLQVESVSWVTETKGLLCALFGLAALWLSLRLLEPAVERRAQWWRLAGATLCLVLALLSKPLAAAVPLMLLVLGVVRYRTPWPRLVGVFGLMAGVVLVYTVFTMRLQPAQDIPTLAPLWARPLVALDALAFYVWKLVWPVELVPDYGRTPVRALESGWLWWTWTIPVVLVVALTWLPGRRTWATAALLFCAGVAPALGLVPFAFQNYSTVGDRYAYLAMLGPALAVAALFADRPSRWLAAVLTALLVACAVSSHWQAANWWDDVTLYRHTIAVNPDSSMAHNNLGMALSALGQDQEALEHLEIAVSLAPTDRAAAVPETNRGIALANLGRVEAAIEAFQAAIQLDPDGRSAYLNLGRMLLQQQRWQEADPCFREMLRIDAGDGIAYWGLASAAQGLGDELVAAENYRRALRIRPGWPEVANNLAALHLNEQSPLYDLGEAVRLAEIACEQTGYENSQLLGTLLDAYRQSERWQDAIRVAERLRELAIAAGAGDAVEQLEAIISEVEARGE